MKFQSRAGRTHTCRTGGSFFKSLLTSFHKHSIPLPLTTPIMNTESQQRTVFAKHRNITQGGSMRIVEPYWPRIYFSNLFENKSSHRSYAHIVRSI